MTAASFPASRHVALLVLGLALALAFAGPRTASAAPAASIAGSSIAGARAAARELLVDLARGRISLEEARARAGEPSEIQAQPAAGSAVDPAKAAAAERIVGTWLVHVPGDAPFDALQTFDSSGTFVETSSLLGSLVEGPAHGAWRPAGGRVLLTFELFVFEEGVAAGRVRVRARIDPKVNRFTAESTVDVILPDGEVIPAVASGPFSATRVLVKAP